MGAKLLRTRQGFEGFQLYQIRELRLVVLSCTCCAAKLANGKMRRKAMLIVRDLLCFSLL